MHEFRTDPISHHVLPAERVSDGISDDGALQGELQVDSGPTSPNIKTLRESSTACLENGRRLLDDAEYLEFSEPATTSYVLSLLAEEEFAKGFVLALVVRGV